MTNTTFRIARNPDADSTSPYLLWVPARFDAAHTEGEGQVAAHRLGMRLPTRRSAAGVLEVVIDSRERYAWKFEQQQVKLSKRALVVGDYAIDADGETVGVVERKKLEELAGNVVDGSLLVTLGELAMARRSAIVVEDRWADVLGATAAFADEEAADLDLGF